MKKLLGLVLAAALALGLAGCGGQIEFTWAMDRVPENLDPQLAWDSPELIAATNLYSGLYRLDGEGAPQLELAESCAVSPDGLSYTFTLKKGLYYVEGRGSRADYPLTAADFVFAFQRIFDPKTASPYAEVFSAIRGGAAALAGTAAPESIGVSAPDERTLVIQLERPDDQLLAKLALPGAAPCNREFFESTQGAYGLTRAATLASGSFYVYNWNENGLFLRRGADGDAVTALRLVRNATGDAPDSASGSAAGPSEPLQGAALVLEGGATAALSEELSAEGLASIPYTATTWVLVFNCENEYLAQGDVRKALAASARAASVTLPEGFAAADGLVPPAVTVDGGSYRESAGAVSPAFGEAQTLARHGFAALGQTRFADMTLLLPEGSAALRLAEAVNQQWQKDLGAWSAYFPLRQLPLEELEARVEAGDFQIALLPLSPVSDSAAEVLDRAAALARWQGDGFAAALAELESRPDAGAALSAEQALLESGCVQPLWFQTKALLVRPGVQGLVFRPFGPVLDLTSAVFAS